MTFPRPSRNMRHDCGVKVLNPSNLYPDNSCSPSLEPLLYMAFTLHTTIRNALVTLFVLVLFFSAPRWRIQSLQVAIFSHRWPRHKVWLHSTEQISTGSRWPHDTSQTSSALHQGIDPHSTVPSDPITITRSTTGAARWLSDVFANDLDRRQCRLREAVGYLCMATLRWLTFLNILTVAALLYSSRKSLSRQDHATSSSRRSAWMQKWVRKMADTLLAIPMTAVGSQRRVSAGISWMPLLTLSVQAILSLGVYWAVDALASVVAKMAARAGN
jgi:hypothetical protein